MAPPVTYNAIFNALFNSEATIQRRQFEVLHQPLAGLEEDTYYSLAEALPLLPEGALRSAALRFADNPNMTFSYRLATADGETVPQFSFIEEPPAPVPYRIGYYPPGPLAEPSPANSFAVELNGSNFIIGASVATSETFSMNTSCLPALSGSYNSSFGVATESSLIGTGGPAGGGILRTANAIAFVVHSAEIGGKATERFTGMMDINDPQGQLAKLANDRFESEAWGFRHVRRIPLIGYAAKSFMKGFLFPVLADGLETAQEKNILETKAWAGSEMDAILISALMVNSDKKGEAMDYEGFEKSLRLLYRQNTDAIYAQDNVLQTLRKNGLISDDELGITRYVDNNGFVTNPKALKEYAADLLETHLKLRNEAIENILKENSLIVGDDGQIASKYGAPFTQEQIDAIRTTRETLGRGYMRLTNALATLRPEAVLKIPR